MRSVTSRRDFLRLMAGAGAGWGVSRALNAEEKKRPRRPNLLFIFADQWRAQAIGYNGDRMALTPNLDGLEKQSVNMTMAISNYPVCSPFRASMLTGRYPLSHGVFMNDVQLRAEEITIADALGAKGYETGYIGKWHIDGRGRSSFIPRERRQGFDFWKVLECTHNYNKSAYYGDGPEKKFWDGYDAIAQTDETIRFLENVSKDAPFCMFLSWGPPHAPYQTAPQKYKDMIDPAKITLRGNVPDKDRDKSRNDLAGYYAHIAALDDCMGKILKALDRLGIAEDTILVFTSDHGDMLYSQGLRKKQSPYDESIRIPFLLRYPRALGAEGRQIDSPFNTPDMTPTLLGLMGVDIPGAMEGRDLSDVLRGKSEAPDEPAYILCPQPFGQWARRIGGKEYRGIRTKRYTFVRDLQGPWLLYDNEKDPFQNNNLIGSPGSEKLIAQLDEELTKMRKKQKDEFLPGMEYVKKWGYPVDKTGTVPYRG